MQAKLDVLAVQELRQLPVDRRPPSYTSMLENGKYFDRFREELWDNGVPRLKCYDDQIPQWYADWERQVSPSKQICMPPLDAKAAEELLRPEQLEKEQFYAEQQLDEESLDENQPAAGSSS